jgi:NHL repeat
VTVDAFGSLFITDEGNQRIRKVSTSGIITTIAGNGTQGFSGDGGLAASAQLQYPRGVTVDATGNLIIADAANQRIRKVSTSGIITTIAGNGTQGFSGDGGPATAAQVNYPYGVALDAFGNLFSAVQVLALSDHKGAHPTIDAFTLFLSRSASLESVETAITRTCVRVAPPTLKTATRVVPLNP